MGLEDLKTFGAVEMVLGLLDVSLGALLLQLPMSFKEDAFVVLIAGVCIALSGSFLVCGGRKPTYCCVKLNMYIHVATLVFSAVTFGLMMKHTPYTQDRYCVDSYSCVYPGHETMVLLKGILAILITICSVATLISLAVLRTGLCSECNDYPQQPEDTDHIGSRAELGPNIGPGILDPDQPTTIDLTPPALPESPHPPHGDIPHYHSPPPVLLQAEPHERTMGPGATTFSSPPTSTITTQLLARPTCTTSAALKQ